MPGAIARSLLSRNSEPNLLSRAVVPSLLCLLSRAVVPSLLCLLPRAVTPSSVAHLSGADAPISVACLSRAVEPNAVTCLSRAVEHHNQPYRLETRKAIICIPMPMLMNMKERVPVNVYVHMKESMHGMKKRNIPHPCIMNKPPAEAGKGTTQEPQNWLQP